MKDVFSVAIPIYYVKLTLVSIAFMKVSNTFPHFYFPCTLYQSPISIPHYAGPKAIKV